MSYREHNITLSSGTPSGVPWSRYTTGQLFKLLQELILELLKRFIKGEVEDKPTLDFFEITNYPYDKYIPIIMDLEAFESIGLHLVGDCDWKNYQNDLHHIFNLLTKKIKWSEAKMDYNSFQRAVNRYLDSKNQKAKEYQKHIQQRAEALNVLFSKYHVNY